MRRESGLCQDCQGRMEVTGSRLDDRLIWCKFLPMQPWFPPIQCSEFEPDMVGINSFLHQSWTLKAPEGKTGGGVGFRGID